MCHFGPSASESHFAAGSFCCLVLAAGAVVAQLEGRALGLAAVTDVGLAAAHLDLIQGAGVLLAVVVGTAGYGTFDTGIGSHSHSPPYKVRIQWIGFCLS